MEIKWKYYLFFQIIFLYLFVNVDFAQSNHNSISGKVNYSNGIVLQEAQLELHGNNINKHTTTDKTGYFHFTDLPLGEYELDAHFEGFETAHTVVKLDSSLAQPILITLEIASVHQEVVVTADSNQISTETSENHDAIVVSQDTLNNLPIFDQDYVGTLSRFLDSGELGTSGVTLVVDGVEANSVGVSSSAIQEVKINSDPYSAEFSRPGRGRVEVTTKPGSLEYHGKFNFTFRDAILNARDPFARSRPPEQRRIYEGVLTGPVFHSKKTFFLFSLDRNEEDTQAVVFALTPSGSIQTNVATPLRNLLVAGAITHSFNTNNTASLRFSYQDRSQKNQGIGGTILPEAGVNSEFRENEIRLNYQAILSPKLVNQFVFLIGQYSNPTISLNSNPKIVVLDTFTGGGAQANLLRTEHHFELTEAISYSSGKHTIKTGINIPDWSYRGVENNINTGGTFYFSNIQDYLAHKAFSFTQQQGNGHLEFLEKVLGVFIQDNFRLKPNLMISAGLRYDWQNYFQDSNNIAPRLSFAYSPYGSNKTVIRGGVGIFYDRSGPRPIQDILLFNGNRLMAYVIPNPNFSNSINISKTSSSMPVSIVKLSPQINIPYTEQLSIGVERQLSKVTSVSVNFISSRGIDIFRSRDINAPLPPSYEVRPNAEFGQIRQIESTGHSQSKSLELSFRGQITRFFTGMMQYRLAKSSDNSGGITYFPPNTYDLSGEWSRSDFDRRHRFELLGAINANKWLNIGLSLSLSSGAPYTLTTGTDLFHTGLGNARPVGIPRNSLQGPGYADLDLRWSHDIFLNKTKKDKGMVITIGLDAFNVLNRVNFASFIGNINSPFFGQAVASQPPRRLQLMARFRF